MYLDICKLFLHPAMMIDGPSVPREVGNGFTHCVPIPHLLVPEGELAVHQGAQIQASDGNIGQLDEFLLDPTTEQIDYVVLHERHLWRHKALMVPASQIERIKDDTIYLKSDRRTIEHLQNTAASAQGL